MNTLFIVEYKAFLQPIHETNIIGSDPFSKKNDANGVCITMIKRDVDSTLSVLNLIIENPNNASNIITGNLEIPFPVDNGVKSNIFKINDVIELVLSRRVVSTYPNRPVVSEAAPLNDFIEVSKKTFADRVRGEMLSPTKSTAKLNTYKDRFPSSVSNTINAKLNSDLINIIKHNKDAINKEKCFKFNERSNCLIVASHQNSENMECCKQCKNMLVSGAKELNLDLYKCISCKGVVYINSNGLPNNKYCNRCLDSQKNK